MNRVISTKVFTTLLPVVFVLFLPIPLAVKGVLVLIVGGLMHLLLKKISTETKGKVLHDLVSPIEALKSKESDDRLVKIAVTQLAQSIERYKNEKDQYLKPIPLVLLDLIHEVIDMKKSEHPNHHIHLISMIMDNQKIVAVPFLLKTLLSNLINNSYESAPNTAIEITLTNENKENIQIKIQDRGPGFPMSLLHILGKKNVTNKRGGQGLGITRAQKWIRSWGGTIQFSNNEIGALITITFPTEVKKSVNPFLVLVDDDELVRLTWEANAKIKKIPISVCATIDEAKEIIKTSPPDILFVDYYLDGEKPKNLSHINEIRGDYPIFLTTGLSGFVDERLFKDHVDAVVGKMFPHDVIDTLIQKKRSQQESQSTQAA